MTEGRVATESPAAPPTGAGSLRTNGTYHTRPRTAVGGCLSRLAHSRQGASFFLNKGGSKMAGGFRFLSLVAPFMSVLPEVSPPDRKIPFRCDAPSLQRAAPLAAACSGRAHRGPDRGPAPLGAGSLGVGRRLPPGRRRGLPEPPPACCMADSPPARPYAGRRSCGLRSRYSSSWCAARSRCTASRSRSLPIRSTGCV